MIIDYSRCIILYILQLVLIFSLSCPSPSARIDTESPYVCEIGAQATTKPAPLRNHIQVEVIRCELPTQAG